MRAFDSRRILVLRQGKWSNLCEGKVVDIISKGSSLVAVILAFKVVNYNMFNLVLRSFGREEAISSIFS